MVFFGGAHMIQQRDAFDETIKSSLALSPGKCCVSVAAMNQAQRREVEGGGKWVVKVAPGQ